MMNRFLSWPIRTHMIILLVLVALPCLSLIVYSGIRERDEAIAGAKRDCLRLVNSLANEQQNIVSGAEQLTAALSLVPEIRSGNYKAASDLFSDLVKMNPQFANISMADASGTVVASALPLQGKVSVADRRSFREAVRTGRFSSGEYSVGRIYKKPVLNFGRPVKDRSGAVTGVIAIVLDLNHCQKIFEKIGFPAGASFSLLDHQGIILMRNLADSFSGQLVGRRDLRAENFTIAKEGPDEGTFEAMGNDGRLRLVAYRKIRFPHDSEPYLYVRSSIPLASVASAAYTAMAKKLGLMVLFFGVGLCLAWAIGRKVILSPVTLLKNASERLATGSGAVNVSDTVKGGELGELARTFDDMATALTEREAAIRESEQRFATTLASIGDAVIATNTEGKITFMNAVAEAATGWAFNDARGEPVASVFNIVNEKTRETVESPVARVLREGMVVGLANHTILVRKDGTEIPIDDSGAPIRDADGKVSGVVLVFRDISDRKADEERIRRLASFPELNPNPVLEVGLSGKITFCNPASEKVLAALGMNKEQCPQFLPGDMGAILANWDKTSDAVLEREVNVKGRIFLETVALTPQLNVARIYGREITERRRALEALQSILQRFYTILSSMYSAVLLVTDEDTVEFANQAFCDYFGLKEPPQTLAGLSARDMMGKIMPAYADPVEAVARIAGIVREGKPVKGEEVAMAKGRTCLRDFVPVYVEGKSFGRAWYHTDITERRQAEAALQSERDVLEAVMNGAKNFHMVYLDREFNFVRVNQAYAETCGYRPEEMIGKNHFALYPHAENEAIFARVRDTGEVFEVHDRPFEFPDQPERGPTYWDWTLTPVKDGDGQVTGLVFSLLETTQRKRAEEALRRSHDDLELRVRERTAELSEAYDALRREMAERIRAEEQLRQSQKMEAIGTLAGGIAHDFNNILASVIGFTEMAIEDIKDLPEVEKNLRNVLKSGMRARELVKQILTFSRKTTYERSPLSLSPIVKETVQLLRASIPKTIDIRLSLHAHKDTVLASPVEIQQILMNLATNSSLAMPGGGTMEIGLTDIDFEPPDETPPGEYLELMVKDTGVGMSREVMKRVFEPFYTTREVGKGTGMGLAVVYGIVRDLQGTITVESEPGMGSAFRVILPKMKAEETAGAEKPSGIPGGAERVLFVDDEEMLAQWGKSALSRLGYTVTALTGSEEALKIFSSDPSLFDLVITDQAMPHMAGVQLATEILKLRSDIPIILCTGHSEAVSPEKAKELGIREFLMKPLAGQELAEAVRRALGENKAEYP